jgi:signal transduction histidine kinase
LIAIRRGKDLTSQLLAFARKGKYRSETVDVHALIDEVVALLEPGLDSRVVVERRLNAVRSRVTGDPTLLQNALLNLALNARDAMPNGGTLAFATEVVTADEAGADAPQAPPAPKETATAPEAYLRISVIDSGVGIPHEVRPRIFEPFFTTKPDGKGSGMGLAAVYGTVQSHHGTVRVEGASGGGTYVVVHLPLA